jgi:integrase
MKNLQLVLDTRYLTKDKRHPLALRVVFEGKTRYISLDAKYTKDEYESIFKNNPKGKHLEHRIEANKILENAILVAKNIHPFDYNTFKSNLKNNNQPTGNKGIKLSELFSIYLKNKRLSNNSQIGYRQSLRSFENYSLNIKGNEINQKFLEDYEEWFVTKQGKLTGTLGIYMRYLRAVINYAIQNNLLSQEYRYPFKNQIYSIPTVRKNKKTLKHDELSELLQFSDFKNKTQEFALDIWKLQFYCNGINLKDLIMLRWDNKNDDLFIIERQKTRRKTRSNPRPIRIPITKSVSSLIEKIGNKKSLFLLGMIDNKMTNVEIDEKRKKLSKLVNKNLKEIGKELGFENLVLSKTSRDMYATTLLRGGASVEEISRCLGHSSPLVTEHYLGDFENKQLFKINNMLPNLD